MGSAEEAPGAGELNRRYHELAEKYRRTSNLEVLQSALGSIQKAVELTATESLAESAARAAYLNNLGRCYRMLYEATGGTSHLDDAVEAGRLSLVAAPSPSELRSLCCSNLSDALSERYFAKGATDRVDFEEALEIARAAVAYSSEDGEYHDAAQSTLASRLGLYFDYIDSDEKYLNEAIQLAQGLVHKTPKADDMYAVYVYNLAGDLKNRSHRYGRVADLVSAKEHFKAAADAVPLGHTLHAKAVRMVADSIIDLADMTNSPLEIEEALKSLISVEKDTTNPNDLAKLRHTKSKVYNARYRWSSSVDDLNRAVEAEQAALSLVGNDSALKGHFLDSLSQRLASRAEMEMSEQDMDAAINYGRERMELAHGLSALEAGAYRTLGNMLRTKFKLFGGLQNLSDSLNAQRNVLTALPPDHKERPTALHGVALSLRDHFEYYGSIRYLDESIELEREAASNISKDDPDRCMILDGLSLSLSRRSRLTGSSQDLDEAVTASESAVEGSPIGHIERPTYLNGLCNRLNSRFQRSNNTADLSKAIQAISEAVSVSHEGSSSEIIYLTTFSNVLFSRYHAIRDLGDLDKAIEIGRKVVAKVPTSNPSRPAFLHNLGLRLYSKYECSADKAEKHEYLREAHDLALQSVNATPEKHPDLPDYLMQLATRQLMLGMFMDESDEPKILAQLQLSATTYERAFSKTYMPPLSRIKNGELCGYLNMQLKNWDVASKTLSESVRLFRKTSPLSLDENDRQRQLRGLSGISSLGCAALISAGKPEQAIEILEAGRGIMANITMGNHADLSEVKEADPKLHSRYVFLRDAISQPFPTTETTTSQRQDIVSKRTIELTELEEIERQIRDLPGLSGFNQSLSAEKIRELAADGPLVSFCTVDQRCDAVIVTPGGIEALPLPSLQNFEIKKRIGMVIGSSRLSKSAPSKRALANKKMRNLLAWLWDNAVHPVLKHLELLKDTDFPPSTRLWWVTSGPLGLLPLHAAGKGHTAPLENVYAHVISSYISSFSALAFARQCQAKVQTTRPTMALITMPQTAGGLAPLQTEGESSAIREAFGSSEASADPSSPSPGLIELRQPPAATVVAQAGSNTASILHFACHAEPSLSDPSNTSLLLGADPTAPDPELLPVRTLRNAQLTSGSPAQQSPRLAYLSACCTAQQYDLKLIDENIHLATAFQLLGFPSVVGTLWEADDRAAVVVASEFYKELLMGVREDERTEEEERKGQKETERVARALYAATAACRGRKVGRGNAAEDVLAWASFVHIGA
ncbi:hypothetical protein EV356DRAFT_333377 [Viridothelium virens]|uniref:CHAT domain-containing protein n=1 Tax=Viridothelium virens TaxID=1048519 RepID=A0A6A6HJ66_VIRVR|nr:hypothetical protein EV356DRAFT_333377 [Viridothelium virens]